MATPNVATNPSRTQSAVEAGFSANQPQQPTVVSGDSPVRQKSVRKEMLRMLITQHRDVRCLALAAAVATYAPHTEGEWFAGPSFGMLGKVLGMKSRAVGLLVTDLTASCLVETRVEKDRVAGQWISKRSWCIARTDGKPDFIPMSRKWLYAHAALGASGIGLFLMYETQVGRRRSFRAKVRDLVAMSGLCRRTHDDKLRLIVRSGLIEIKSCRPEVEIAMLQNTPSQKRTVGQDAPTSQKTTLGTSQKTTPVLRFSTKPSTESKESKPKDKIKTKGNTGYAHDQRIRAVATELSNSQDQNQTPSAVVPAESWPPTHDNCTCVQGWLYVQYVQNGKEHTGTKRCQRELAWAKYQQVVAKEAAEEAEKARLRAQCGSFSFFSFDIFARPSAAPALPPAPSPPAQTRTIEGQWRESKPPAPQPQRVAGDVMSPKMYRDLWDRIETESRRPWGSLVSKRIDGMLRKGEVAKFGAERFEKALRHVFLDQWEIKHGKCIDCKGEDGCDGSCGHNTDDCETPGCCDGDEKRLLDAIGHAIQWLRQDEKFGRDFNTGCPNPIYQRMFAA
jgi:hypothetical protein